VAKIPQNIIRRTQQYTMDISAGLSDTMSMGEPASLPYASGDHFWAPTKADNLVFQKTDMNVIVRLGSCFIR